MNPTIDWQALKDLTEYCREDIKGFCEDEGLPAYPGRLHPYQALFLRNLLLCNWSVREGHFAYYWKAQQTFELLWAELPDDISDYQLAASWIAWCEVGKRATGLYCAAPKKIAVHNRKRLYHNQEIIR